MYTLIVIGRASGVSIAQTPHGAIAMLNATNLGLGGLASSVIAPNGEYVYASTPLPNVSAIDMKPVIYRLGV